MKLEKILRNWLGERFPDAVKFADEMEFSADPEMIQGEGKGRTGIYAPSARLGEPEAFCNCPYAKAKGGLCYHLGGLFLRALREDIPDFMLFPALSSLCPHRTDSDPPTCNKNDSAPGECKLENCYWL